MLLFMSSAEEGLNLQDKIGVDRFAVNDLEEKVAELKDSASEGVPLS
jgi:hypothetical protein